MLYVDDMLIVGNLSKSFAMKDLGPTKEVLAMCISRNRKCKKL